MIEGQGQSPGVHHKRESEEIALLSFRLKVLKQPTALLPLPVDCNRVSVT